MAEHVGVTIKKLREERKLSKSRLAREAGFSDAYLVQIEKGQRNPSASVLRALAKALRVPPHTLLLPVGYYDDRTLALANEMVERVQKLEEAEQGRSLTPEELDRILALQLESLDLGPEPTAADFEAEQLDYRRRYEPLSLSPEEFWQWNETRAWAPEHWNTLTQRDRNLVQELINRLVELAE